MEFTVSPAEYSKLVYLIHAYSTLDQAYHDFRSWRKAVAFSEGITVDARINWRLIENHCAPQVLLVMVKESKDVPEHPQWAVLTETLQVIPLSEQADLSVQGRGTEQSGTDVMSALNALTTYAETRTGGKRENALRQIQILRKILR